MVLLLISIMLFSLVALELTATIKKSAEEGHFAFLSPLVQSSGQLVLSERLNALLEKKDTKNLQALLEDAGIIKGPENTLDDFQELERAIAKNFEQHYSRILHYLPDDLKEFFQAYKILWDVENLKSLLCNVLNERVPEKYVCRAGPFGFLDLRNMELLAKFATPKEILENAFGFLPVEFSSKVNLESGQDINDLEFSSDRAAFEYLREKSEEIGTRKVRLVWDSLTGIYEVENLIIIARLKYSNTPSQDISKFLFPSWKQLDDTDVYRLLRTEDYSAFLRALKATPYGECFQKEKVDPMELEDSLKKELQRLEFEETQRDINIHMILRFLIELETRYDIIRKAAFFVSIKTSGEE